MKHRGSNSRVFPDLSQPYENQYTSRHCVNNKSLRLACHSFLYRFRPAGGAIRLIAVNYGKDEGIFTVEGLPGRGGSACSLVPYENLHLFSCSSKINWDVPRNSLLLSSPVPRNSAPFSLDHQKYSSLFPTIPSAKNKIFDLSPGHGPKNERIKL